MCVRAGVQAKQTAKALDSSLRWNDGNDNSALPAEPTRAQRKATAKATSLDSSLRWNDGKSNGAGFQPSLE
jgi:hypothetical protein